ncbi:MAG: phytanoyl-CoA dioxygenase family protein [Rhodobacterales bacterium]|nr:phytanoyl-CoA dioxygenase family protein [Rhodobacterales bacterium]
MLSVPTVTDQQIADFKDTGYLVLRGAYTPQEVALFDTWTNEVVATPETPDGYWVYHETSLKGDGRDLICRIEKLSPFHAGFQQLQDSLRRTVGALMGEEAVLFKEKINFKMPGGDGFKPHQDSQAGWDAYADFFVSALVCIDEATIENGCLQMVAGHHQKGLYQSWEPLSEDDMAGMDFRPCPTQPGDVVFFDCYAPHASDPNMTDATRRIYFATYNKASEGDHMAAYYADKFKSYPPDICRQAGKEYVFRV